MGAAHRICGRHDRTCGTELIAAGGAIAAEGLAVVIGAAGGIGGAMVDVLRDGGQCSDVMALARSGAPSIDVTSEDSVAAAAQAVAARGVDLRLVFVTTGFLHGDGQAPEKSWRDLDPGHMAHAFAVNAIGPAMVMKHFLPLFPRAGRSVFAALSARVGSVGDNRLGGWHSYRAAKAALNQLIRTASIELKRTRPDAICVALHPGTVATALSAPFGKAGLEIAQPHEAAERLLTVIEGLAPEQSGGFFDQNGTQIPW